jgi:hypothetical protein
MNAPPSAAPLIRAHSIIYSHYVNMNCVDPGSVGTIAAMCTPQASSRPAGDTRADPTAAIERTADHILLALSLSWFDPSLRT